MVLLVVAKVRGELARGGWAESDHFKRSRLISSQAIPGAPLRASAARFSIYYLSSLDFPGCVLMFLWFFSY
jgi:hypothetical protein